MGRIVQQKRELEARKRNEIADYIRNQVASGKWEPESKLPPRTYFIEKFGAASLTVQRAFSILLEEKVLTAQRRVETRVAKVPPHLNRFALLLYGSEKQQVYHTKALVAAAEILREKGYEIDQYFVLDKRPEDFEYKQITHKLANNCYAGAFFESTAAWHLPMYEAVRHIPIAGFFSTEYPEKIVNSPNFMCINCGNTLMNMIDADLRFLAGQGVRKVACIGTFFPNPEKENRFRRTAESLNMTCPPGAYLPLPLNSERDGYCRNIFRLLFSPENGNRPDGIILRNETILPELSDVLHEYYGDDARKCVQICSIGNYPVLPEVDLSVSFSGFDMLRTLENGLKAIAARRRGEMPLPLEAVFLDKVSLCAIKTIRQGRE